MVHQSEPWVLWTATRLALGTGATGLLVVVGLARLREAKARAKGHRHLKALQPILQYHRNGSVSCVERFGEYAARQIGVQPSDVCYDTFKKVAEHYVRGDKSKSDTSRDELMALAVDACSCLNEERVGDLTQDLVKELDACILSFFGFHWSNAELLLEAASSMEAKRHSLKRAVLSATRVQRYKQLLRSLGPQRQFVTLVQQLKKLRTGEPTEANRVNDKEVAAPVEEGHRSPVILFMAGGMGAGKSTVRGELMQGTFWRKFAPRAVVVEADAFKENDVVYQALNEQEGGVDPETASLVHSSSVKAALSLLVAAINEGRDVIFDGTMSWEPFVVQTIEMVRDAHLHRYRMGPGYQKREDGSILEQYWEVMPEDADVVEEVRAQQQSDVRAYDTSQAERYAKSSNRDDEESASERTESEAGNKSVKASGSSQSLGGFSEIGGAAPGDSFKSVDVRGNGAGGEGHDAKGSAVGRIRGGAPEMDESGEEDNEEDGASGNGDQSGRGGEGSDAGKDDEQGGAVESTSQESAPGLGRGKGSGHWAHIDGNTLKSNQPSQGPSGFSRAERGAPRKMGRAADADSILEHAEGKQSPASNDVGHRPGLVPTGGDETVEKRRPYRVEMVGVACDAGLSVVRGMRRAILTGRGVPVEAQLRSHRMFAASFENYARLVDRASLYVTNGFGSEPELVALKDGFQNRLLVDPPSIKGFRQLRHLNEKADSVSTLYKEEWGSGCGGSRDDTGAFGGAWARAVLGRERKDRQMRLQEALRGMDFCSLDLAAHWNGKNGHAKKTVQSSKK